jgi:hypothetical protein
MKNCLKIILPAMLAVAAHGTPLACTVGTYASYQALGAGGCTVGNELFSNFSGLSFSNSMDVPQIPTSDIVITPTVSSNVDSLAFSYQNLPVTPNQTSTVVGVGNNQILGYDFTYVVAPNPNPVADVQMTSTISNTNTAAVSAVKDANTTGGPLAVSTANDGNSPHPSLSLVAGPIAPISGSGAVQVLDAISLQGQTGVAQQQDFTNLFTEGPAAVAEPGPVFLIGSGLVSLGLVRKRFRREKE